MPIVYTPSATWTATATLAEDGVDDDVAVVWNAPLQAALDRTEHLHRRNQYEYHIASYNTGTFVNNVINNPAEEQVFTASLFPGGAPSLRTGQLAHFDMTGMIYHTAGVGYYANARLHLEVRFQPDPTWYSLRESFVTWDTPDFQLPGGIGTPFRLVGSYQSPVHATNIEARIAIKTYASLFYPLRVKRTYAFSCRVNASAQRIFVP